jgi:tRNA-dihydrouridine synthase
MPPLPIQLGPVPLGFPVVQAALSGYSDWPMRLIARRQGASYAICEEMLDLYLVTVKDNRHRHRHSQPGAGAIRRSPPSSRCFGVSRPIG